MTSMKKQTAPLDLTNSHYSGEPSLSEITICLFPVFDLKYLDDKNRVMD